MAVKYFDSWPKADPVTPSLINGERQCIQEMIHTLSLRHVFWNGVNPELER